MKVRKKRQKTVIEGCFIPPLDEPFGIVIFGASGDLTRKKLLPAIENLSRCGFFPKDFFVLGVARTEMDDSTYRNTFKEHAEKVDENFLQRLYYQVVDYTKEETFKTLKERLQHLHTRLSTEGNTLFYLAVPPQVTAQIVENIGRSGLKFSPGWKRIVLEKPFGWDLQSARRLNELLHRYFLEEEIFRIDHYLGKETVQDILLFRFANSIFEPVWNRNFIDHIQITAAETVGVEGRTGYYDKAGIIRDMFQNHLFQLLSLVSMEPPSVFEPARIREEKVKVFRSLRRFTKAQVPEVAVFGQYIRGEIDNEKVPGYRDLPGIPRDSHTPTFAALKVFIDNWRWQGVPFYLRSGKRLNKRVTEVSVHFRGVPHSVFRGVISEDIKPNVLVFRIQPDEAIELVFQAKAPGATLCLRDVKMNFSYRAAGGVMPDAYERVLLDCLRGDHLLFVGQEGVEQAWEFFDPIIKFLERGKRLLFHVHEYPAGSWGPKEAEDFIKKDGYQWWVR